MKILKIYAPNWSAPKNIHAFTTTKTMGNIALHVEDNKARVLENRMSLQSEVNTSQAPAWLEQTHSNRCIVVEETTDRNADAAVTRQKDTPLVVMTADCIPILLCNQQATEVAAIHCGWRGLVKGTIENTLQQMQSSPSQLMAWIGPAVCGKCYEVGEEVRDQFVKNYDFTRATFAPTVDQTYKANLPLMTELILNNLGVSKVYQSNACTYEQENDFYSYRRNSKTGRIATLIWFT
jgi:YfiH family protein